MNELVQYSCCGNDSPQDYKINGFGGGYLPKTCCGNIMAVCTQEPMYKIGCREAQIVSSNKNWSILKYIYIGFVCAEICGVLLIGLGTYIIISFNKTDDVNLEYVFAICLIVLGSIIFLIAFFGCCGAIRESYCMTITYVIFLILLVLVQIGIIYSIYSLEKSIEDSSRKLVDSTWKNRIIDPAEMDELQVEYNCCGNESPQDYKIYGFGGYFPKTCCDSTVEVCTEETMHKIGCREALTAFSKKHWENVKYGNIGVACIEIAGIIAGCCLINNIRNIRRRTKY